MRGIPTGRRRAVVLVVATLVVLGVIVLAVGAAISDSSDDANPARGPGTTRPPPSTRPAGEPPPDPNTTVSVFAPLEMRQVLEQLTAVFTEANPDLSVEPLLGVSSDLLERVQTGEESGIYIDEASVVARVGERRVQGEPSFFGRNLLQLVVQRGNPKKIRGLAVFGAQPATTSGVCSEEVPCGVVGEQVLQAGGVVAVPDRVGVDGRELAAQVATGQVDAALLFRSDARFRLRKVQAIPFPEENVVVEYQRVRFGQGAAADQFAEFLESEQAQRILQQRGFLALYFGGASAS